MSFLEYTGLVLLLENIWNKATFPYLKQGYISTYNVRRVQKIAMIDEFEI